MSVLPGFVLQLTSIAAEAVRLTMVQVGIHPVCNPECITLQSHTPLDPGVLRVLCSVVFMLPGFVLWLTGIAEEAVHLTMAQAGFHRMCNSEQQNTIFPCMIDGGFGESGFGQVSSFALFG